MEKASDEFQSKLAKKEREAEARTQEKEELLDTVNKMKTKLEREAASHYDAKQHITDLNRHIEELKAQVKYKENLLLALITNRQAWHEGYSYSHKQSWLDLWRENECRFKVLS